MIPGACSAEQVPSMEDQPDWSERSSGWAGKIKLAGQQDQVDPLEDQEEDDSWDGIDEMTEIYWEIVDPVGGKSLDHDPVSMWLSDLKVFETGSPKTGLISEFLRLLSQIF